MVMESPVGLFMGDLTSRKWIIFKGCGFALITIMAGALVVSEDRWWGRLVAYVIGIWAAARFYYFCFYVLERYVGLKGRYAGLLDLIQRLVRKSPK